MRGESGFEAGSEDADTVFRGLDNIYSDYTKICEIKDEEMALRYRGYEIEELTDQCDFEDVSYLLIYGELPSRSQKKLHMEILNESRKLPESVESVVDALPITSSPMSILRTGVSAFGCYLEDKAKPTDPQVQAVQILSVMPLIVGRFRARLQGRDVIPVESRDSQAAFTLSQFTGQEVHSLAKEDISVVDDFLILHAEHEFNASCFAARVTASTLVNMSAAITTAIGTLAGSLHGGANLRVLEMAEEIAAPDKAKEYVLSMFKKREKVHGFGQRACKAEDPRVIILRFLAEKTASRKGGSNILPVLIALNEAVRSQKYLWPNVDFYSAALLHDLGVEPRLFTPLFACSRVAGWSAHALEQLSHNRLIRPKAKYVGPCRRDITTRC